MSVNEYVNSLRAERGFGLLVGAVIAAVGAWFSFREKFGIIGPILLGLGVILIGFGRFYPKALIIPARLWMGLAEVLSFISTHIILAFIFFVVITPIGFVKKLFGWDPLQRHFRFTSYWVQYSERQQDSRHYEKMF